MNHERFFARVMRQAGFETEEEAAKATRAVLAAFGDELSAPEPAPQPSSLDPRLSFLGRLSSTGAEGDPRPSGMVLRTFESESSPSGRHLLIAVLPDEIARLLLTRRR